MTALIDRARSLLADERVRYVLVGGWNTVFGLLVFAVVYRLAGDVIGYPAVLLVTQIIAVLQAHFAQRLLVWRSKGSFWPELARFAVVYTATYFANLGALAALVELAHMPVIPAQALVTFVLVVITYAINRTWTFRPSTTDNPSLPEAVD